MKKLLLLLITMSSCTLVQDQDEVLYLKTDNAYLPVYVRGNSNSDTYIIWVHGGPGSSGLYYGDMPEVSQLHKNYRVVYWDQLSAGGSIGTPQKEDFTTEKYATHMQGVVNIIKNRYSPKNIYILGHSWGGFLAAYYLIANGDTTLSKKRQSDIRGFIGVNPVFDIPDALTNGITFITNYAQNKVLKNNNKKFWQKKLDWYKEINYTFRGSDVALHFAHINDAGGFVVNQDLYNQRLKEMTLKSLFDSPFNFYSYYDNQKNTRIYLDIVNCSVARNNAPNLSAIEIPTLMLAGEADKVAFLPDSERWYQTLIKGKADTSSYYFKKYKSAHAVFLDESDKFFNDIQNFIEYANNIP